MYKKFKFSLIMPTLGRKHEVDLFLKSLINQNYINVELIVVDQNDDEFIKELCSKYSSKIDIKYIHSTIKGLSKCRNIGLKYASGDIVAFPDDDCEYSDKLLLSIVDLFNNNCDMDILTFKSIDKNMLQDSNNKWSINEERITSLNMESTATSYTIFIKLKEKNIIKFDKKMGVGEFFGSAEEIDMLSTLINKGYIAIYTPELYAYHPIKPDVEERYYKYALGMGAFIKKEIALRSKKTYYKKAIELILVRPIGGIVVNIIRFNKEKVKKYYMVLSGRIEGFIKYKV